MRKLTTLVVLIGLCFTLTACWKQVELNELSITSATAYDLEGNDWILSYQVIIPSAISQGVGTVGGSQQTPVTVYSTRGHTIREAVTMNNIENPRWLFFAHTSVVVISDEVARKGLDPIIDLYLRNPEARETVYLLITEGNARSILEQLMHAEKIPGQGIREIIENESQNSSKLPGIMMYELAIDLTSSAKSAVIPEIVVSGEPAETSLDALKRTTSASKLKLGRLAVLKGDQLAGWLSREEGFGVAFITNQVNTGTIAFQCKPSGPKKYDSSYRISKSKTKLTPEKDGDHYKMRMDIQLSGTLLESLCDLDFNQPAVIKQLEQQLQNEVISIINRSFLATKRLKVDVLGFADEIHRKYPKEWKTLSEDWSSSYVKMAIDPHVTVKVERVGLTGKTFRTKQ